jgi:sugar-specific transcriptional regulator TrmB
MEQALIERLEAFGLSSKEAHLYVLLLKYGPKTTGELAKMLHSYRVDIYRLVETLMEKGMIEESVEKPTKYAAVAVDAALAGAMMRHAYELRWMEENRDEVLELAQEYLSSESTAGDLYTFKIVKGRANTLTIMEQLVAAALEQVTFVSSQSGISVLSASGIVERCVEAVQRGVRVRCVTEIVPRNVGTVREALAGGVEVRHYNSYEATHFFIVDARESLTTITFDTLRYGKDATDTAFWTNSPEYAQYLEASFELLWDAATDATQVIDGVLEEIDQGRTRAARNSS